MRFCLGLAVVRVRMRALLCLRLVSVSTLKIIDKSGKLTPKGLPKSMIFMICQASALWGHWESNFAFFVIFIGKDLR